MPQLLVQGFALCLEACVCLYYSLAENSTACELYF